MTNEVYQGRDRSPSKRKPKSATPRTGRGSRYVRLFVKQLAAAAICLLIVYVALGSDNQVVRSCTDALSRAIHYETDWQGIFNTITEHVSGWFHAE